MSSSIGLGTTPESIHLCSVERWIDKSLAVSEIEYFFSIQLMRHTVVYVKKKIQPDWLCSPCPAFKKNIASVISRHGRGFKKRPKVIAVLWLEKTAVTIGY